MSVRETHVGQPRDRIDGSAKVTGAAKYAAEFDAPDLLYGVAVPSTISKGRIASIDIEAAGTVLGVIRIFYACKSSAYGMVYLQIPG